MSKRFNKTMYLAMTSLCEQLCTLYCMYVSLVLTIWVNISDKINYSFIQICVIC